ncbi:protein STICHEL-like 2 isoform X1 [Salvia splendens]|uniref:protein STICHEL-like 2 isoform X1 n=1 Tax=Salvia splendens TaxID=180675 RepID=UPI001C2532D2|nr:protein STICHEL-like 2 isoform X1 [Salvia splendens]
MDGRRRSVDVPLSRTLIALRRVRSLRDPSTNSMSKLNGLVDNVNWEAYSNDTITIGVENSCHRVNEGGDDGIGLRNSTLVRAEEHGMDEHKLYNGSRNCMSRLMLPQDLGAMVGNKGSAHRSSLCADEADAACDSNVLRESYCKDYGERYFNFKCNEPDEGGASCDEPDEELRQVKKQHSKWHPEFDGLSSEASPCLSLDEARNERASHGISLYEGEDAGFMDSCHQGCGISSCWSRGRKLRGPSLLSDVEEQPLLSEDATVESIDSRHNCGGVSPYVESPRSLCQKFMPKSFGELIGQSTVTASLSDVVSKRQIASLYLFHGPRGTGKTSGSRIFAAALNCLSVATTRPCGMCKECGLFFSGRSTDVKEVDSARINKMQRCRFIMKNARSPPVFSRFKVYIIDECHLLQHETWAAILNGLEEIPRHVVFIMVTPNLDKLPRAALTKSQKYHFQRVKEVDITTKLGKICVQEGLDFDQDALNFIAAKSNGSLHDAEMMLDQLSLLGKKITVSLVHEVNGVVSDDELLDLLYLAMSSDASNTVRKARELMGSRIDPLQLASQLASLIMDILAGKCPSDGVSEMRRSLFGSDNSEDDTRQLSHALKILSQTEKQLRKSNNQMTWLTVALLQLSSVASNEGIDPRLSTQSLLPQDGDFLSSSSTGDSFKRSVACACGDNESANTDTKYDRETLDLVWIRSAGMCASSSLKKFLLKCGNLASIRLSQARIAVVELEFDHPDYASRAEKSWKEIAGALQLILGYNVELRINVARDGSSRNGKAKKPCLSLLNCSRRVLFMPQSSAESGANGSSNSGSTPTTDRTRDRYVETCSSECTSQVSCLCCHRKVMSKTIRSSEGNALSIEASAPNASFPDQPGCKQRYALSCTMILVFFFLLHLVFHYHMCITRSREHSRFHCWRAAMFPFRKAWQLRHHHREEHLVDYPLH